jgi:hypothetical protein
MASAQLVSVTLFPLGSSLGIVDQGQAAIMTLPGFQGKAKTLELLSIPPPIPISLPPPA